MAAISYDDRSGHTQRRAATTTQQVAVGWSDQLDSSDGSADLTASEPGTLSVSLTTTGGAGGAGPIVKVDTLSLWNGVEVGKINVLSNDADPAGYPLTVVTVTKPKFGSINCAGTGVCTYTGDNTFPGFDSVQYTVFRWPRRHCQGSAEDQVRANRKSNPLGR
jgi:hypothetical protein